MPRGYSVLLNESQLTVLDNMARDFEQKAASIRQTIAIMQGERTTRAATAFNGHLRKAIAQRAEVAEPAASNGNGHTPKTKPPKHVPINKQAGYWLADTVRARRAELIELLGVLKDADALVTQRELRKLLTKSQYRKLGAATRFGYVTKKGHGVQTAYKFDHFPE